MKQNWDGTQTCGTLSTRNAGGAQRMPDKDNFQCVIDERTEPTYLSGVKGHNSVTTDGKASTLISQEKDTPIVTDRWQLEREIEAAEDAEIERYELEEIGELEKWDKETNGGRLTHSTVRRLTPRECERLQGFPDDWSRWGVNEKGEVYELSDSARYTLQGNSIARPFWTWLLRRIAAEYEDDVTLGSLFDGQGGFPLCGAECGIKTLWASEIEKNAVAVTKYHFGDENATASSMDGN